MSFCIGLGLSASNMGAVGAWSRWTTLRYVTDHIPRTVRWYKRWTCYFYCDEGPRRSVNDVGGIQD
jgi:hypothetical protein